MANSNRQTTTRKVRSRSTTGLQSAKPYSDFPLFVHASGRWAKKISVDGRAKLYYFGRVKDGWEAALERYDAEKVSIAAGRTPSRVSKPCGITLIELADLFTEEKLIKAQCGKMTWRSFNEYRSSISLLLDTVGRSAVVDQLEPKDFHAFRLELSRRYGTTSQTNHIIRVRSMFKHGFKVRLIPREVNFGEHLALPSKREVRLEKAKRGDRLFRPVEIRKLLKYKMGDPLADPIQMRAMILLGINAALGNDDVARLTRSSLDLRGGWCETVRNKTGTSRRAKLWPETVEALRRAIAVRPTPSNPADDELTFITKYGGRWYNEQTIEKSSNHSAVASQFAKSLRGASVKGGRGFYSLRHTFFTVAANSGDREAASAIMGHIDATIGATYLHCIDDARYLRVAEAVRRWLFRRNSDAIWKPLSRT